MRYDDFKNGEGAPIDLVGTAKLGLDQNMSVGKLTKVSNLLPEGMFFAC
jgi:hypothetical protein